MSSIVNYYQILDVDKSATRAEIRAKYVEKIKKWHPDRAPKDQKQKYTDKAKLINAAWAILSDNTKRKEYDLKLNSGEKYNSESFFEGGDYFGNIFNNFMGQNVFGSQNIFNMSDNFDSEYDNNSKEIYQLKITIKELYAGAEKSIEYNQKKKCETCNGSGRKKSTFACPVCNGMGHIRYSTNFGGQIGLSRCGRCRGTGKISEACTRCNGSGNGRPEKKILKFTIPKRFNLGGLLKFKKSGGWIGSKGAYGDLYLKLILKDKNYKIQGLDIIYKCVRKYSELSNGSLNILMPEGANRKIRIPKNFLSDNQMRIKNAGLVDGYRVGSLLIDLIILFDF